MLLHGNLYDDQILVEATTGRLTGVIDFVDAAIGDAALDVAGLLRSLGEPFVRQALLAYGASAETTESLLLRAAVYAAIVPLHETLYGLEIADRRHTAEELAERHTTLRFFNSWHVTAGSLVKRYQTDRFVDSIASCGV